MQRLNMSKVFDKSSVARTDLLWGPLLIKTITDKTSTAESAVVVDCIGRKPY